LNIEGIKKEEIKTRAFLV